MRLLFDLQPLVQSSRFGITGIARWTLGAIHHLQAAAPDWQIEGFALCEMKEGAGARPNRLESRRRLVPLWNGPMWLVPDAGGVMVDWGSDAPDAVLGTAFLTPAGAGVAEIPVVHDLAFIKHPETQPEDTLAILREELESVLGRAPLIVTVSEAMKKELTEHYGIDPALVEIVSPGSDPGPGGAATQRQPPELPPDVPERFLLVVGTLEPRKNIRAILQAHRSIRQSRPDFPRLVFAGGMGWRQEQFSELLDEQIAAGHVISLGYVSQSSLDALYRRAIALVFPSLYEGFGLPILEAMASGCPVITSNCTGTVEAAGDAAILVDPNDLRAIGQAMERIFDDPALRQRLQTKGREHALRFSWHRTGERLKAAIIRAVEL